MSTLRVLHVLPGLDHGGVEQFVARLVLAAAPDVASAVVSLKTEGAVGRALARRGVPVVALGADGIGALVRRLPHRRRVPAAARPDVVQGWTPAGSLAASLVAAALGRPVLWSVRTAGPELAMSRRGALLGAVLPRLPPPFRVVCVSDAARANAAALGVADERVVVVENGFDAARFRPRPKERDEVRGALGLAPDDEVWIAVQRCAPEKDTAGLLAALRARARDVPAARLVLVGPGYTDASPAWATGIDDDTRARVRALGPRDDVERLLAGADVFVSASRIEGLPNAVAEALLAGLPAVVTDVGDTRRLAGPSTILVAPGDPRALVDGVARVRAWSATERAERTAQGRAHVEDGFGMARVVERYRALWEDARVWHRRSL